MSCTSVALEPCPTQALTPVSPHNPRQHSRRPPCTISTRRRTETSALVAQADWEEDLAEVSEEALRRPAVIATKTTPYWTKARWTIWAIRVGLRCPVAMILRRRPGLCCRITARRAMGVPTGSIITVLRQITRRRSMGLQRIMDRCWVGRASCFQAMMIT